MKNITKEHTHTCTHTHVCMRAHTHTHTHTHTRTGMNTYCTYMQIKISRRCILQCFQCTVAMQDYCKIEMQSALTVKKSYKQVYT